MDDRFTLACDNDGHWYVIPLDKRAVWCDVVEAAENGEDFPEWVGHVNGPPTRIVFREWYIPD